MTMHRLIESGERINSNDWISYGTGKVYLRATQRLFEGSMWHTFDIGDIINNLRHDNVNELPEALRAKTGFLGEVVGSVESIADQTGRAVFIENVLVSWLEEWYDRRDGYKRVPEYAGHMPCFYRLPRIDVHPGNFAPYPAGGQP